MGAIANGYDLRLADRGEGLSGGQRQSIAIARALAGKPPLVIFDEPSSAMDNQTENALIQRLQTELKDRTFLLITHRPPLLALVTRIMLIDKGKVVANGPRDEVLKQITRQQPGGGGAGPGGGAGGGAGGTGTVTSTGIAPKAA
jgi:ATP-binding cassette, subfamily C, bacterial LapB